MTPQAQKIEALLFVAGEAVPKQELAKLLSENVAAVEGYLDEIRQSLAKHGVALVVIGDDAQLVTSPAVAEYLAAFQQEELKELTKAAAETVSIIAYRGPISRYDVDVLRGVDSRGMIRQLIRRGLVRQVQRAGRTPLYDITGDFLMHLGVKQREDLPEFAALSNDATIQRILEEQE